MNPSSAQKCNRSREEAHCKKCANVHTSRSADEAEKKGIPSVALQVPFLTTWAYVCDVLLMHPTKNCVFLSAPIIVSYH